MFEKPQIMALASSLAAHAAARQSLIARNVANADTPGYRAVDLASFVETYSATGDDAMRATRPGHLGQQERTAAAQVEEVVRGTLSPNGNGVSLETEMVKAAEVRRDHDMALAIYGKSLAILRASLGRR
ncbi:FlgB family protein [Albidovulum sp.]